MNDEVRLASSPQADAANDTLVRDHAGAITGAFVNVTSGTFPS